jgi:hypothetical protein
VDLTVNARLRTALTLQGGLSTGRKTSKTCSIAAQLPETLAVFGFFRQPTSFCDQATPYLTQWKALTTYTIPRIDVQVAGTFQSLPFAGTNFPSIASQSLAANWFVLGFQTIPDLGRPVSAGFASLNLVKPGELYGDRINQVDIRAAKILRYGRTKANIAIDLFNIFNANPVLTYNQSVPPIFGGAAYLSPTSALSARLAKLTVQFDW